MISKVQLIWFIFLKRKALKIRCVKFINSDDNSPLSKQEDEPTELPDYISNTYEEKKPKDNQNTEEDGKIRRYPTWQRRKPDYFVIENFEFSGIDYCYTMHTIPTNYTEVINSEDTEYWVSTMQKEFDSLVESNTFELQ